jgi:hypothetical protein
VSGPDLFLVLLGAAVLLLLVVDIFVTVLHHWGGQGPLGKRFVRAVWRAAIAATSGLSAGRRRQVLGRVGPALIPLMLGVWALLAVFGFALLYLPWIPTSFSAGPSVPPPGSLWDAAYFSGVTFFTLGYGDLVPLTTGLRILAFVQAGAGFALVTLAISYFLSVYAAYSRQKVLAESLFYQSGGTADAARIIARHLAGGDSPGPLRGDLARLRDGLAEIRSQYANYSIMHYFVPSDPQRSLLRVLFVLHDLSLLLDTALDASGRPELEGLGERSGLLTGVESARKSLSTGISGDGGDRDHRVPPDAERQWAERFGRALDTLRRHGVPAREDPAAVREYCRRRREWEPELRESAAFLGEDWAEVAGGY